MQSKKGPRKTGGMKSLSSIRSDLLSRGVSLAKMTASAGAKMAQSKLGEMLTGEDASGERAKKLLVSQAQLFAKEMGQLKGSLMKVGQMLSMYGEHFLPPEANNILKTLQFQSPPLEWKVVAKTLAHEFGAERLAQLAIEPVPMASASIGQVHRARVRATQQVVAIKIQYPGVDQAIENDMRTLKSIFSVTKLLPQIPHFDHLLLEIKDMLTQELDYQKEMQFTIKYRNALAHDQRYVVPNVLTEFSTHRVLTSEFVEGFTIDSPEVQALSLERRNRLGLAALELYLMELFVWGFVQTDPHLGNYRVKIDPNGEDDRLVLFDFGALREFSPEFCSNYQQLVQASINKDMAQLKLAAIRLGFSEKNDPQSLDQLFADFCFQIVEPFEGSYNYAQSDLPKRMTMKVGALIKGFKLRAPPREIVFLDRKTGGVFIFLKVLGCEFNARPLLERYLSGKNQTAE